MGAHLDLIGRRKGCGLWVGVSAYLSLILRRRGGRLFEAGRLLTLSAFRMGAYSRWALIRGWALIRINTVRHIGAPFWCTNMAAGNQQIHLEFTFSIKALSFHSRTSIGAHKHIF